MTSTEKKYKSCISWPSSHAPEPTAPTPTSRWGAASSGPTASTTRDAMSRRQSTVYAHNKRQSPRWSRTGAGRSRRSTWSLNYRRTSWQPLVATADSTSNSSPTTTYTLHNPERAHRASWKRGKGLRGKPHLRVSVSRLLRTEEPREATALMMK